MFLKIIEAMLILITLVLAGLWINDPNGNYEPWIVLFGSLFSALILGHGFFRWSCSRSQGEPKRISKPEELIHWIQKHGAEKPLSQILPHALQLSKLLRNQDLEHWIRMELYGYNKEGGMTEADNVPEYRGITGQYIDKFNRVLHIDNAEQVSVINSYRFRDSVRKLEEFAQKEDMQNIRDESLVELYRRHFNVDVDRYRFSPIEVTSVLYSAQ